jgi:hypothetical protein
MSFDQLPDGVATGKWYLDELYGAWRAASGEADDAYANWSRSLTHSDYDSYVAATDRADAAAGALPAEHLRRRGSWQVVAGHSPRTDVVL